MSNEDIISGLPIRIQNAIKAGNILNKARTDERDTLISEIDTTLQNALKTAYDGSEVVTAIQTKLNELRAK